MKRKTEGIASMLILLAFAFAGFSFSSNMASAQQYTLCSSGCNFSDITTALQNITNSSDTIIINESGVYTVSSPGTFYVNESGDASVLVINATGVTVDCAGSNITGNAGGRGITALKNGSAVQNCNIISYSSCIVLDGSSSGSALYNNSLYTCNYGITLSDTNNSMISSNLVSSALVSGVLFSDGSQGNQLVNSRILTSVQDISSSGTGTSNTALNSSFLSSKLSSSDTSGLYVAWYFTAYVDDSSGNPVSGATVNITDASSSPVFSLTTGAGGYTDEKNITAYLVDASGTTSYNNHTIYAYNSTHSSERPVNISSSGVITVTLDTTEPAISAVDTATTNSTAAISWETDDPANSTVEYGTTSGLGSSATDSTLAAPHSVNITSLLSNTTYYFNITSCNRNWLCSEEGTYNFTTNVTVDVTTPNITLVMNATIGPSYSVINWSTSENATSVVKYGAASGAYTNISSDTGLVLVHTVNISGLEPSTTYYYVVNSTDGSGNSAESDEYSFTTDAEPDLTAPTVAFTWANRSAMSDWKNILPTVTTSEAATCYVDSYLLGTTSSTTDLVMTASSSANTTHYLYFNATADSSGYNNYFTVKCKDSGENFGTATIYLMVNDTSSPIFSYNAGTPGDDTYTNNQTLRVGITVYETPYSGYPKIKVDSGSLLSMTASSTSHVYTYTSSSLSEASHVFTVVMADLKGNLYNSSINYTVDITEPEMDFILPDGATIRNCNALEMNLTLDEEGECEYEIFFEDEEEYDECIAECDEDYDDCYDDADDSSERSECSDEKDDCEDECEQDKFEAVVDDELPMEFGYDECVEVCEDLQDDCEDACQDEKTSCLVSAYDGDDRDDCEEDYDDCEYDCEEDYDDCEYDCRFDMEYIFYEELSSECFDDGPYFIAYTCEDLAGNEAEDNDTFVMQDTTSPSIISSGPNGTVTSSTASLRAYTNENSRCRFSTHDTTYASMESEFIQTGTSHAYTLENVSDGSYVYYIRCNDTRGNVMTSSCRVEFTVNTSEPVSDAESAEVSATKSFPSIAADSTASLSVDDPQISLTSLEVKSKAAVSNVRLTVTKVSGPDPASAPSDKVYQYLSIEKEGITSEQVDSATIKFRVDKSWLSSNGLDPGDVYLGRYTTEWTENAAMRTSDDSEYYYYTSLVPGLSIFAVMSKEEAEPAQPPGSSTATGSSEQASSGEDSQKPKPDAEPETEEPIEIIDEGTSWWVWMLICVVVVGGVSALVYVYLHRHPQQARAWPRMHTARDSMAATEYSVAATYPESDSGQAVLLVDAPQEVLSYIAACLDSGQREDDIRSALVSAGHDPGMVESAIAQVTSARTLAAGSASDPPASPASVSKEDEEVLRYIAAAYGAGQTVDIIRKTLVDAGHNPGYIDALMSRFTAGLSKKPSQPQAQPQIDPELSGYIMNCMKEGLSDAQISKLLEKAGHEKESIKTAIKTVRAAK